jgi:glycosyltransferase involved in cell wall biosynthesis
MALPERFAIVSPNFYPRVCGVGDHTALLARELRKRGHEAKAFSRLPVAPHPEVPDLEVHGAEGERPMALARHLALAIRDYRPTHVVLQYTAQMWNTWRFGSPALPWLAAQARRSGARVTLLAHELFNRWSARPDLMVGAALQRAQFAALLKTCHQVFVITATRASLVAPACRLLGVPEPRVIRVGPNAVPIAAPRPPADAGWGTGPRIGFFSTVTYGKRFDVVLETFARLVREFPHAELVIMGNLGSPSDARVAAVLAAVEAHPARARIRITGKLALQEIAAETAKLDLYLFAMDTGANTRSGTLPVALGSGVPVVAVSGPETDAGFFRDDDNVAFARAMTADAFTETSLRLLRDPLALRRIGEGGRQLYEAHISWPRTVDDLLAAG